MYSIPRTIGKLSKCNIFVMYLLILFTFNYLNDLIQNMKIINVVSNVTHLILTKLKTIFFFSEQTTK